MKKNILLIVGAIGLLLLIFLIFSKGGTSEVEPEDIVTGTSSAAQRGTFQGEDINKSFLLHASNNLEFKTLDFLRNGETIGDPSNQGNYILAGSLGYCLPDGKCPSGFQTEDFSISYSQTDEFFTIVILNEPIAEVRKQAELFLKSRLGVGDAEMCQLRYSFSVPYWVNEFYTGRELGFSFCPGSVSLE